MSTKLSLLLIGATIASVCPATIAATPTPTVNLEGTTNLVNEETQLAAYYLIPPLDSEVVGLFVEERPEYSQIVGYSAIGHVFLYAPEYQDYVVFYPYRQAGKSYGSFDSIKEFDEVILKEESFSSYVLQDWFLQQLIAKHGPLDKEEVFIPAPYFDYDSDDVNIYDKGNIWVMLQLTNQFFHE